jgi:hypothetical protein
MSNEKIPLGRALREEVPNEFEEIYKMTKYELEQQNANTLVQHIIDLKNMISQKIICACGKHHFGITQIIDQCISCLRPTCNACLCDDCFKENCKDCIKKCKFCEREICKTCIYENYPEWSLTGCSFTSSTIFVDDKITQDATMITDMLIIKKHCIYFYPIDEANHYLYCGEDSYCSNICSYHYDFVDDDIRNAINMLPSVLIDLCIEYFYRKIDTNNCKNMKELID